MKQALTIAFWSPFHGQAGQTTSMAAVGTYIGVNFGVNTMLMHTQYTKSSLENAFLVTETDTQTILFNEKGIDAVEKLARTKQLSDSNIKDYTTTLITDRLDILQGTNKRNSEGFGQIIETIPYIVSCAKHSYTLTLCDVNSGSHSSITSGVLENSDLVVVCLNQNVEVLKAYFEKRELHPKIENKKHLVVLGNYDSQSKYSAKYIKRIFKYKDEIYTVKRCSDIMDAHNDNDFIKFFFANSGIDRDDENYFLIKGIDELARRILKELKVDIAMIEKPLRSKTLLQTLNIFKKG